MTALRNRRDRIEDVIVYGFCVCVALAWFWKFIVQGVG